MKKKSFQEASQKKLYAKGEKNRKPKNKRKIKEDEIYICILKGAKNHKTNEMGLW